MGQCQAAERTAKRVHSKGQQSKRVSCQRCRVRPRSIHTRGENASDLYLPHAGTADAGVERCTNPLAGKPTLAGRARLNATWWCGRCSLTYSHGSHANNGSHDRLAARLWPKVPDVHGGRPPASWVAPCWPTPVPRALLGGSQPGCALLSAAKIPGTAAWRVERGGSRVRTGAKTSDQGELLVLPRPIHAVESWPRTAGAEDPPAGGPGRITYVALLSLRKVLRPSAGLHVEPGGREAGGAGSWELGELVACWRSVKSGSTRRATGDGHAAPDQECSMPADTSAKCVHDNLATRDRHAQRAHRRLAHSFPALRGLTNICSVCGVHKHLFLRT